MIYKTKTLEKNSQNILLVAKKIKAGDIVALNAGAAIYAANLTDSLSSGVKQAQEILFTGDALNTLDALVQFTNVRSE